VVVDHESASIRRINLMLEQGNMELGRQKLEINPDHPIMQKLEHTRQSRPDLAKLVLEQIFDNALIAADLMATPQSMLSRLNKILESTLESKP